MFDPKKGLENPIIKRAIGLCEEAGMKVAFHADTVEVWFSPSNKRFYTIWSQFLADAEAIFGDRMHDQTKVETPAPSKFGRRKDDGLAAAAPPAAHAAAAPAGMADAQAPFHVPGVPSDEVEALKAENAAIKREMKILERAIRVVGMQSEEWKKEAEAAKRELESTREEVANLIAARGAMAPGGSGVDRYKQVRQVIIRRLHPDVPGTDEEKAYREKLFKTIWAEIEGLDKK